LNHIIDHSNVSLIIVILIIIIIIKSLLFNSINSLTINLLELFVSLSFRRQRDGIETDIGSLSHSQNNHLLSSSFLMQFLFITFGLFFFLCFFFHFGFWMMGSNEPAFQKLKKKRIPNEGGLLLLLK